MLSASGLLTVAWIRIAGGLVKSPICLSTFSRHWFMHRQSFPRFITIYWAFQKVPYVKCKWLSLFFPWNFVFPILFWYISFLSWSDCNHISSLDVLTLLEKLRVDSCPPVPWFGGKFCSLNLKVHQWSSNACMCSLVPLFKIILFLNGRWGEWGWWNKYAFVTLAKSWLFYFLEIITLNFLFCSFCKTLLLTASSACKEDSGPCIVVCIGCDLISLAVTCVVLEIIFSLCGFRSNWESGQPERGSGEGFWADLFSAVPHYLLFSRRCCVLYKHLAFWELFTAFSSLTFKWM